MVEYHLLSAQRKGSPQDQTQSRQDTLLVISPRSYLVRSRHVALLDLNSRASIWAASSKGAPGWRLINPLRWVLQVACIREQATLTSTVTAALTQSLCHFCNSPVRPQDPTVQVSGAAAVAQNDLDVHLGRTYHVIAAFCHVGRHVPNSSPGHGRSRSLLANVMAAVVFILSLVVHGHS